MAKIFIGNFKGPKGDPFKYEDFTEAQLEALKGPQGEPGWAATGFFKFEVDEDGNLCVISEDGAVSSFEYDAETGNLYHVMEDS